MNIKKAIKIICLIMFGSTAPAFAHIQTSIKVIKISSLEFAGKDLLMQYELPCGAKKLGLLAAPKSHKRLRLGVVIEQQSTLCAAMPSIISEKIDFIAYSGFRELIKMAPETLDSKLNLASAKELRVFRHRGRLTTQAIFQSDCSEFAGIVLEKNGSNQVQLSFLETQPKALSTSSAHCSFGQKVKSIDFLKLKNASDVASAVTHRPNPLRSYQLRFAEIKAQKSLKKSDNEIIEISYLRKCNEAPIGIVVGNDTTLKLGMLVAQYYNMRCDQSKPASTWATYQMQGLPIPSQAEISWIPASGGFGKFQVVPPSQYAVSKAEQSRQLILDFWTSCAKDIGAVYARDASKRLVVGILQHPTNSPCKNSYKEVSLTQPLISSKTKAERIFPMKLAEGTALY